MKKKAAPYKRNLSMTKKLVAAVLYFQSKVAKYLTQIVSRN
jgi:hypothetical protein